MNILEKIIAYKRKEVIAILRKQNLHDLEKSNLFFKKNFSLSDRFYLGCSRTGIIAEFKRKSPSKGMINSEADGESH